MAYSIERMFSPRRCRCTCRKNSGGPALRHVCSRSSPSSAQPCMQPSYSNSPGRRQQQASVYTSGDSHHASAASSSASTELYRSLVFGGSVPLCISLLPEELPAGSDRCIDSVYVSVGLFVPPRVVWLTLRFCYAGVPVFCSMTRLNPMQYFNGNRLV